MKKLFFSAIAICGFVVASNAQAPLSATSSAGITLTLQDAIELTPANNANQYSATFSQASDYNSGMTMGTKSWNVKSTKAGNISYAFSTNLTGGPSTMVTTNVLTASPSTTTFAAGAVNPYSLSIWADPQWSYAAGVYTGSVTVTATQN